MNIEIFIAEHATTLAVIMLILQPTFTHVTTHTFVHGGRLFYDLSKYAKNSAAKYVVGWQLVMMTD